MAYIDAELAKRQGHDSSALALNGQSNGGLSVNGALIDAGLNRQPAALGKLHEFDLGPDATLKNIARTEAAKRRLEGGDADMEEERGKIPLRRNGKPWRGRRRRNSDDVKRDKLVEEVMKETRCKCASPLSLFLYSNDHSIQPLLTNDQWKFTTNQTWNPPMMTKRPTTALRNSSGATSWMQYRRDDSVAARPRKLPRLRERKWTIVLGARSLEGVEVRVLRCGSCKKRRRSRLFISMVGVTVRLSPLYRGLKDKHRASVFILTILPSFV